MARSLSFDLARAATVHRNLDPDSLHRLALQEDQCLETETGALVAYSGKYTGRSPKDKAVVRRPETEADIWWENNAPMEPEVFEGLREHLFRYAEGKTVYVVDAFAGADPRYRIKVRFVLERAYHALFIRDLMIRPRQEELEGFEPDWTIYDFGKCSLNPAEVGTRSDAAIVLDFQDRQVLIAGTEYAGEIKKSVFTIMNFLLPKQGVLSMHCSANQGREGDVALFFGLSGTGKTTLSADPERSLIGDDEHGWSDYGVFNIEGGCYAKCIHLSEEREPQIYRAVRRGAVLENVPLRDGVPDYDDVRYTENTRCAYPLDHIENALQPSMGGHPKNIVFLTCDALGVLPPISRLDREQAMYWFLSGYTAKVAGTEAGITEPQVTFSTCFGAPFLPLHPKVYAKMLGEKMDRHGVRVWLLNTGWTGGPFGVGSRIRLKDTRAMIRAAFAGQLDEVAYVQEPVFGLAVPSECAGVDSALLLPQGTWSDPASYHAQAHGLKARFEANYAKFR